MTVSNARITLHFNVHQPVELTDLTLSFGALAKQYRKFLHHKTKLAGQSLSDDDIKLYITRIENNCIIAELAGAAYILGALVPLMDYSNLFVEFIKNIRDAITYFGTLPSKTQSLKASDIPYTKGDCSDVALFLKTVASNKDGELGLGVLEYAKESGESRTVIKATFTSDEAYEAQKGAEIAKRALEYRSDADYQNVLMYFHQTNVEDPRAFGRTGDKAIIRAISDKPLPVYFVSNLDSDKVKSFISDPNLNPFKASYRVDVNVEADRNEVPKFYRVMTLHEIIPDQS